MRGAGAEESLVRGGHQISNIYQNINNIFWSTKHVKYYNVLGWTRRG